jgi:hypothetical protein
MVFHSHFTIIVKIIWADLAECDLLNSGFHHLQTTVPLFCDMTLPHSIIVSRRLQTTNLSRNIRNKTSSDVVSYPKGKQSQIHRCENRQIFKLHDVLECVSVLSDSRWHFRWRCYIAVHKVNNIRSIYNKILVVCPKSVDDRTPATCTFHPNKSLSRFINIHSSTRLTVELK